MQNIKKQTYKIEAYLSSQLQEIYSQNLDIKITFFWSTNFKLYNEWQK